jgi:hypothetical protein
MKALEKTNGLAPDISFKEFAYKFPIMFFICIPIPIIGLAIGGYHLADMAGFHRGMIPAAMTLGGATIGAVLGFFMTVLLLKIGHKE